MDARGQSQVSCNKCVHIKHCYNNVENLSSWRSSQGSNLTVKIYICCFGILGNTPLKYTNAENCTTTKYLGVLHAFDESFHWDMLSRLNLCSSNHFPPKRIYRICEQMF